MTATISDGAEVNDEHALELTFESLLHIDCFFCACFKVRDVSLR